MSISLTDPLDLKSKLKKPEIQLGVVPIADLLCILLFLSLFSSQFIFAPGVTVDLPQSNEVKLTSIPTVDVLTIKRNDLLIFQGRTYSPDNFSFNFESAPPKNPYGTSPILLKVGKNVSMQAFLQISEKARQAGFTQIQIAAEEMPLAQ